MPIAGERWRGRSLSDSQYSHTTATSSSCGNKCAHRRSVAISVKMSRCQDDIFPRIELIPSFVLSSDNTNCKNDIQLFHQLFDELSVHTDYH